MARTRRLALGLALRQAGEVRDLRGGEEHGASRSGRRPRRRRSRCRRPRPSRRRRPPSGSGPRSRRARCRRWSRRTRPPAMIRSKDVRSTTRSSHDGEGLRAPGLDVDRVAVRGTCACGAGRRWWPSSGRARRRSIIMRARAADALAAVVLEGDGLLALVEEALVQEVEHLEERHVRARRPSTSCRSIRPGTSGPAWRQTWRVRFITCSSASPGGRSRTRAAPCAARAPCPRPACSHTVTWEKRSSSRFASPSGVWCSSRKWPPHDSSRVSASRHRSSANSRKSATRPAFSRVWLSCRPGRRSRAGPSRSARGSRGSSRSAFSRPGRVARHAALVPHEPAELGVERVGRARAVHRRAAGRSRPSTSRVDAREVGVVGAHLRRARVREVAADRVRAGRSSRPRGPA